DYHCMIWHNNAVLF
nr:immunoglobulin light chain junction region [Macaca mulatta]MOW00697.1 immunoglobulin light chain junction region [Macaca mulatta]